MFVKPCLIRHAVILLTAAAVLSAGGAGLSAEEGSAFKEPLIKSPAAQFKYAAECFKNREYETALYEFKRFLHFFQDHGLASEAFFYAGTCCFRLARYEEALRYYRKTASGFPGSESALEARFRISSCLAVMGDADSAAESLYRILESSEDETVKDRARWRLGWLCLENGKTGSAEAWLERISRSGREKYGVEELVREIQGAGSLPRKSPVLAGVLSIVPGGGYLYCGRLKDAAIAFLVNAALAGAAVESFDSDLEVLGGILAFAGAGFYAGSIYGGISSAHKYNRSVYNDFVKDLKERRFTLGLSPAPAGKGFLLSLTYRF